MFGAVLRRAPSSEHEAHLRQAAGDLDHPVGKIPCLSGVRCCKASRLSAPIVITTASHAKDAEGYAKRAPSGAEPLDLDETFSGLRSPRDNLTKQIEPSAVQAASRRDLRSIPRIRPSLEAPQLKMPEDVHPDRAIRFASTIPVAQLIGLVRPPPHMPRVAF